MNSQHPNIKQKAFPRALITWVLTLVLGIVMLWFFLVTSSNNFINTDFSVGDTFVMWLMILFYSAVFTFPIVLPLSFFYSWLERSGYLGLKATAVVLGFIILMNALELFFIVKMFSNMGSRNELILFIPYHFASIAAAIYATRDIVFQKRESFQSTISEEDHLQ